MSAIKYGFGSALSYIDKSLNLLVPPQIVLSNDAETRYITQIYTSFYVRDEYLIPTSKPALLRIRLTRNIEPLIYYPTETDFSTVKEEDDTIFLAIIKNIDYSFSNTSTPHHMFHFDPPLVIPRGKSALVSLNHFTNVDIHVNHQQIFAYLSVHGYTQQDKLQELQELR